MIAHVPHTSTAARSACRCPRLARGCRDRSDRTIVLSRDATYRARAHSDRSLRARVSVIDPPAAGQVVPRCYIWCFAATSRTRIVQDIGIKDRLRQRRAMELGDRVYAAERITKKREKRVSIADRRVQMALPGGIRPRAVTAPPSLFSLSSYLASLISFFFSPLPLADSRLRAAAASLATLAAPRCRTLSRRQDRADPFPVTWCTNAVHDVARSSSRAGARLGHRSPPIHRRFCHRRGYRFAPVNETAISRPVTLRHR